MSGNPNNAYSAVTGDGDVAGSTGGYTLYLANRTVGTDVDDQLGEATAVAVGDGVTGQAISGSADVDMYRLAVSAGQRVAFDIDQPAGSSIDSYLRLFDVNGKQLAANNNGAAPGEAASSASYLEYTFATGGTYFVGVSGSPNKNYNAATGGSDLSGRGGAYTLTLWGMTAATAVTFTRIAVPPRGVFSEVAVPIATDVAREAREVLERV